jgi:DNA-binding MltR family transcriptional regulator
MAFFVPKDIEAILDELKDENDRAVALVGASLVEHTLQEAIRSVLRPFDDKDNAELKDRIFGNRGIFSGLSAKILGAFVLSIIGKQAQRDLELINKIRNTFAHDMNPLDFSNAGIKSRCSELQIRKNSLAVGNPRREYLLAVQMYSAALNLWSIRGLLPEGERLEILDWLSA